MDHECCAACGFDGAVLDDQDLVVGLHQLGPSWAALLADAGDLLRVRPATGTWSALEYAAHSRDITALHVWAVEQALGGGEPVLPAVAAGLVDDVAADYGDADPADVLDELEDQADRLADVAQRSGPATWDRGITIGDSRSDVRRLLEHGLHDSRHHLDDVARGLAVLRART